jgi:hypothetical protein
MNPNTKYSCEKCLYFTNKKYCFDKHNKSKIHEQKQNNEYEEKYECVSCKKKYKTQSGLWKHKKLCNVKKEESTELTNQLLEEKNNEIKEMKNMIIQMKEMISELAKSGQLVPTNTNINSNNKIDINVFLNEKCQNAVNMSSLIKDIVLGSKDIENIEKHGYVKAITDKIVDKIGGYSVYERPLHYFIENNKDSSENRNDDEPQETIHIKENNKWNVEDMVEHDVLLTNINTINDALQVRSNNSERVKFEVTRGRRYDRTGQIIKNVLHTVEIDEEKINSL